MLGVEEVISQYDEIKNADKKTPEQLLSLIVLSVKIATIYTAELKKPNEAQEYYAQTTIWLLEYEQQTNKIYDQSWQLILTKIEQAIVLHKSPEDYAKSFEILKTLETNPQFCLDNSRLLKLYTQLSALSDKLNNIEDKKLYLEKAQSLLVAFNSGAETRSFIKNNSKLYNSLQYAVLFTHREILGSGNDFDYVLNHPEATRAMALASVKFGLNPIFVGDSKYFCKLTDKEYDYVLNVAFGQQARHGNCATMAYTACHYLANQKQLTDLEISILSINEVEHVLLAINISPKADLKDPSTWNCFIVDAWRPGNLGSHIYHSSEFNERTKQLLPFVKQTTTTNSPTTFSATPLFQTNTTTYQKYNYDYMIRNTELLPIKLNGHAYLCWQRDHKYLYRDVLKDIKYPVQAQKQSIMNCIKSALDMYFKKDISFFQFDTKFGRKFREARELRILLSDDQLSETTRLIEIEKVLNKPESSNLCQYIAQSIKISSADLLKAINVLNANQQVLSKPCYSAYPANRPT